MMGTVQAYSVKCVNEHVKIPAMGESVPTGYYRSGRTYTITLKKVYIKNTKFNKEDTDGIGKFNGSGIWADFELIITKHGVDGGRDRVDTYRNCYRIESGEEANVGDYITESITIVSHNVNYSEEDTEYFRRRKMKIGSYEFPYNPYESELTSERRYVEHRFPGLKKSDLEDFGLNAAVIHCAGYFFQDKDNIADGKTAGYNLKILYRVYKKGGVNKIYHPVFTGITKAMMVNFHCKVEDKSSLIQYDFDLIEYTPPKVAGTKKSSSSGKGSTSKKSKKSGKIKSTDKIKVGDSVYITGMCYSTSYGNSPHSKKYSHTKMTITRISKTGTHRIHLGTIGWAKISDLSWS